MSFSASRRRFVSTAAQTLFGASLLLGTAGFAAHAQTPGVPTASMLPTAEMPHSGPRYAPGELLVGVKASSDSLKSGLSVRQGGVVSLISADAALRQRIETLASARTMGQSAALGFLRLQITSGESVESVAARLKASGLVSYAEPNYVRHAFSTPNDPYYTGGDHTQWGPQKIQADKAWEIWSPQTQTVIAIIDTGVMLSHPDLVNKLYKDGQGNLIGYNFVNSGATAPDDDHGHGTHCAGIAAAQINNGIGVAGIAGWNGAAGSTDADYTKIRPLKVLDSDGNGYDSDVALAIVWAADHGARVISMSLGGSDPSQTMNDAVTYAIGKNSVVVAAAGNANTSDYSYPGACPGTLCVASTGTSDALSDFSNYGSWVTVAAPGELILSTFTDRNLYAYLSGTSMSCPHVAGEVALLASQKPSLTSTQLFSVVQNNTDPIAPSGSKTISGGRVNVFKALTSISAPSLAVPSGVAATANSRSMITLTWTDTNTTEDGYAIEMSTDGTTFTSVGTVGINKTSAAVSGLNRSTKYYFRVRAFQGTNYSAYSSMVSATTKLL